MSSLIHGPFSSTVMFFADYIADLAEHAVVDNVTRLPEGESVIIFHFYLFNCFTA